MSIFSKIGHAFKKGIKKVAHVGEKVVNAGGKVIKEGAHMAKDQVQQFQGIGKNIQGLTNPSNMILILGVVVVAIMVLPKVIDSAGNAGQKIGDSRAGEIAATAAAARMEA